MNRSKIDYIHLKSYIKFRHVRFGEVSDIIIVVLERQGVIYKYLFNIKNKKNVFKNQKTMEFYKFKSNENFFKRRPDLF